MNETGTEQNGKALGLLVKMQQTLIRRLADYVTENRSSLRLAADGAEGYGYNVHQLDELFLSRLNLIERTIAELQKLPAGGASRYRTQCFLASRGEVEEEINSRLEMLSDARILGVSVSPAAGCDGLDAAGTFEDGACVDVNESGASADQQGGDGEFAGDQLLVTVLYYGPAPGSG